VRKGVGKGVENGVGKRVGNGVEKGVGKGVGGICGMRGEGDRRNSAICPVVPLYIRSMKT